MRGARARDGRSRPRPRLLSRVSLSLTLSVLSAIRPARAEGAASPPLRRLRALGLSIGGSANVDECHANIRESDANGDGKLSPDEYLNFVQVSAEGKLDTKEMYGYSMPITRFDQLPQEFTGVYNYFACGDPNVGCPSVVGVDVGGISETRRGRSKRSPILKKDGDQQEVLLYNLCSATESAIGRLPAEDASGGSSAPAPGAGGGGPTRGPTASPTFQGTGAPTASPATATGAPHDGPPIPPAPLGATAGPSASGVTAALGAPSPGLATGAAPPPSVAPAGLEPSDGAQTTTTGPTASAVDFLASPTPHGTTSGPSAVTVGTQGPTAAAAGLVQPAVTHPPSAVPTSLPSVSPASTDESGGVDELYHGPLELGAGEEPYHGPIRTTFQYEIYNTLGADASSIMSGRIPENSMMADLLTSTATFVQGVVEDEFGDEAAGAVVKDLRKQNVRDEMNLFSLGDGFGRRLRGGRKMLVSLVAEEPVLIDDVEDVACTNRSLASTDCQRVTAAAKLVLMDEPRNATELRFQMVVSLALDDPGILFPEYSGIVYVGAEDLGVSAIPDRTDPGNPPAVGAQPDDLHQGLETPGWVVPLSVGAAAVGSVMLILFVGSRYRKRRRTGKEFDSQAVPRRVSPEQDLGCGDGSFEGEIRFGAQPKISPLDANASPLDALEGGMQSGGDAMGKSGPNPFLTRGSSSSSDPNSSCDPLSECESSNPFSECESSSSSSDEDIKDEADMKEFWKNRESEVTGSQQEWEQSQAGGVAGEAIIGGHTSLYSLSTLHEVSESNLSMSGWSLSRKDSDSSGRSEDKSVYRAGVEALVKEACPDSYDKIDEMMAEYEGREQDLIGHLSTMLARKNRENGSGSDTEDEEDDGPRSTHASEYTFATGASGYDASTLASSTGCDASTASNLPEGKLAFDPAATTTGAANGSVDSKNSRVVAADSPAGSAAGAVAALLASQSTDKARADDSSSAGSSDWSSDDGFSSIDTSSFTASLATDADHGASPRALSGAGGEPKLVPVASLTDSEMEANKRRTKDPGAAVATCEELDRAIEAGDWGAVGATASLIADGHDHDHDQPSNIESTESKEDFIEFNASNASSTSVSSHEKREVQLLEHLVEAGDWSAVMAAASRYEADADTDSLIDLMETKQAKRAEIEELVKTVIPEELENLDEMFLQYRGREEDLVTILHAMKRREGAVGDGSEEDDYLLPLRVPLRDEGSDLSVFESGGEGSSISTQGNRRGSLSTSSDKRSAAGRMSHDDADSTIASDHEDLRECSVCSRHLTKLNYSETQWAGGGQVRCSECDVSGVRTSFL